MTTRAENTGIVMCTGTGKEFIHYDDRRRRSVQNGKSPAYYLETPRLILRPIQESDAEDLHEIMSKDAVMKYW